MNVMTTIASAIITFDTVTGTVRVAPSTVTACCQSATSSSASDGNASRQKK